MKSFVLKFLETCERIANILLHPGAEFAYIYICLIYLHVHTVSTSAHVKGVFKIEPFGRF